MGQITVFSGPERRRRWSAEARLEILNEAFAPGACVSDVARRHDVATGLIYTWRRKFRQDLAEPGFAEAVVADAPLAAAAPPGAALVIELSGGRRVSIAASAPPGLASAVLKALR
ncbi:MAG TPA: transposase [Croceibacterium sp.]|nr:transposase [Croceibacterium sp.]